MIRGLVGVVPARSVEPGRFYLTAYHEGGAWLFQCVQTGEPIDDGWRRKALFLTLSGKADIGLGDVPDYNPLVALPDVNVRVDPTSIAETPFRAHPRAGTFLVDEDQPILCVPHGFRGWEPINLATGRTVSHSFGQGWLSFTRWSLVVDDETGEELTIASFGNELGRDELVQRPG